MGIFVFLALGTDYAIYRFWYTLFHLERHRILKFLKDGATSSSRSLTSAASVPLENSHTSITLSSPKAQ